MKIGSSLVEKEMKALLRRHGENIIRKRGGTEKRRRRREVPRPLLTGVQKLFDTCREVFRGPGSVPPPRDVQKMQLTLDKIVPEDFGLSRDLVFFKPRSITKGTPRITCTTIYQCENFSLCIFFLPPSAVIPLHNHPGMTVFNKLLFGSMHIKAYDWVDPVPSNDSMACSRPRLARLEMDTVFTAPCKTSVLYPASGGNIHAFTAVTPCAVLDVFGPPYSKEDDRDCTYYRDFDYSEFTDSTVEVRESEVSYRWLEETEMPKDLKMDPVEYLGPQIIES